MQHPITPNLVFNPKDHYWQLVSEDHRLWSSKRASWVEIVDAEFAQWAMRDLGLVTQVESEEDILSALMLAGEGWRGPGYVPAEVFLWQAKAALKTANKLTAADTFISTVNDPRLSFAWEYAALISRNSPAVEAIGKGIGLDKAGIDDLFKVAAAIKV